MKHLEFVEPEPEPNLKTEARRIGFG
eukprot:SAG11_NODE_24286_length_375_cov_1.655797_1_plen_25_part_10